MVQQSESYPPRWPHGSGAARHLQVPVEAKGKNGRVVFDGVFVTIYREGLMARSTVGGGEQQIPVSSIVKLDWKGATRLFAGYIRFDQAASLGVAARPMGRTQQAVKHPDAVVFWVKQQPAFERLRAAVTHAIAGR